MIVKETIYTQNAKRVTPDNYWRHDSDESSKFIKVLERMESQVYAEFLGHSDFNDIVDEKYIEIV